MTVRPATRLQVLLAGERRRQRGRLLVAGMSAASVAGASVLLLGLSGCFLTAASAAGLAGAAAASAFNALLPSAGIRLLAILRTGCRYTERLSGHDAALRAMANIRPALFGALAGAPPSLAMAMPVGDATARLVQDVSELEVALVQRSSPWAAWAAGISGFGLLLIAGGRCAAALVAVLAASLLLARLLAARMDAHGRTVAPANGALKQAFATLAGASAELRAYGLEQWAADRIDARSMALIAAQQRVTAFGGWFDLVLAAAAGLAATIAMLTARTAPLPVTALAVLGAVVTVDGMAAVIRSLQQRGRLQAAETRLDAMLSLGSEPTQDRRSASHQPGQLHPGCRVRAAAVMAWPPAIEVRDLAMTLPPGTVAGLRGPSGCGKTTLIEQMLRLRDPGPGRIRLGGADLMAIEPALARRCFAAALQDAPLLAGTIRDNLLLADPTATDEQFRDALHDAALDERVQGLPQGLDTWIGENGARLSGGERRRLVLARAMLRDAPWLLLDEPTEGLDARTEAIVVDRLRARLARSKQGALIVSHRVAPLAACNIVFDMIVRDISTLQGRRLQPAA